MWLTATSGIGCALAFSGLIVLTIFRGRFGREGMVVVAACCLTAIWALVVGLGGAGVPGLLPPLDVVQSLGWLAFIEVLLTPRNSTLTRVRAIIVGAAVGTAVAVILNDAVSAGPIGLPARLTTSQILGREAVAILGLLLVENLYRNTAASRIWNVIPLCIALGGLFAYQLFLYTDALLFGRVDSLFDAARPLAMMLIVPFLVLSFSRNQDWRIDIHVSRRVVLHTLTFVASGLFLLGVAVSGVVLRQFGGDWGALVQVISLFGSLLVLATALSSGGVMARLKYLISRNFFSLRYDYRAEWMRFIDILSGNADGEDLKVRVIRAVANIVESPAGVLWLVADAPGYRPMATWNMRAPEDVEPVNSPFIDGFRGGGWTQVLAAGRPDDVWHRRGDFWLAVPLAHQGRLLGFIALAAARAPITLTWESYALLRAVARQAASYLSEERTARELNDARRLEEMSKRFAFIAHDIKNLTSQLRMIVANAQRHGDNPDFRADVWLTIEGSVARMDRMLLQLNAEHTAAEAATLPAIDPRPVVAEAVRDCSGGPTPIGQIFESGEARVRIAPDRLRSSLTHLINNAIEASDGRARAVTVRLLRREEMLYIEVCDEGEGMDPEFIHDRLFRPLVSTKSGGYGIGVYQTRELVRAAGGDLDVISSKGAGTTMRIILPIVLEGAVATAA